MKTLMILGLVILLMLIIKPKVTIVNEEDIKKKPTLLFSKVYKENQKKRNKIKNLHVRSF